MANEQNSRGNGYRSLTRCLVASLLLAGSILSAGTARAQPTLPGANSPYNYVSVEQDVNEVIRFFALNLGIGANIAPGIQGRVSDAAPRNLSRQAFIDHLAAEFRFVWYFDGTVLHMAPSSSVQTEVFALENNNGARVMTALSRLDLYQPKFRHRYDLKGRVFMVSGPPSYVSNIKKAVEALEKANRTIPTILRGAVEDPVLHSLSRMPDVMQSGGVGAESGLAAE
ncbi:hypothetical protein [Chelativorans sp. Marseille-P2723]|uniref:hypothetical protein n=1 Tax=Chelativorans sp. Marseille-P2723 TaxID=2709133 RepID=UPI00156D4107|nr:hypothetical protein [Chelativorans sp. Marseille-P2723]